MFEELSELVMMCESPFEVEHHFLELVSAMARKPIDLSEIRNVDTSITRKFEEGDSEHLAHYAVIKNLAGRFFFLSHTFSFAAYCYDRSGAIRMDLIEKTLDLKMKVMLLQNAYEMKTLAGDNYKRGLNEECDDASYEERRLNAAWSYEHAARLALVLGMNKDAAWKHAKAGHCFYLVSTEESNLNDDSRDKYFDRAVVNYRNGQFVALDHYVSDAKEAIRKDLANYFPGADFSPMSPIPFSPQPLNTSKT